MEAQRVTERQKLLAKPECHWSGESGKSEREGSEKGESVFRNQRVKASTNLFHSRCTVRILYTFIPSFSPHFPGCFKPSFTRVPEEALPFSVHYLDFHFDP